MRLEIQPIVMIRVTKECTGCWGLLRSLCCISPVSALVSRVDTARRRVWCRRRRLKLPEAYWYHVQTPAPVADFALDQGHVAIVTHDWEVGTVAQDVDSKTLVVQRLFLPRSILALSPFQVLARVGLNNVHQEGQSWLSFPSLPKVTVEQILHHGLLTMSDKRLWLATMDGSLYTLSIQTPALATVEPSELHGGKYLHESVLHSTDMQAIDSQWQAVDAVTGVCALTCLPHAIVVADQSGQVSYGTLQAKSRLKLAWTTLEPPIPPLLLVEEDMLAESTDPTLSPVSSLSPVTSTTSTSPTPLSPLPYRSAAAPAYFSFRGYMCLEHLKRHQPAPRVLVPAPDSTAIVALSLNPSGCYMCCITADGTVWGRFGMTKSEPAGTAWVPLSWRQDDQPIGQIVHIDVRQAENIPTLPSTPLEPGAWSDSVHTQVS